MTPNNPMNADLLKAEVSEKEGALTLTLGFDMHIIIDGKVRLYLNTVRAKNEVRLTFISDKAIGIQRSNRKRERNE